VLFYIMTLYEIVTLVYILDAGLSHFWSSFSTSGIHGGPVFLRVVRFSPSVSFTVNVF
jgi:long-subunit fatty acid transport protein